FLVGDANSDYRDYYGSGKKNRAPVHMGITAILGLTPDDNWYVCMDGEDDILPDMFIGRIPGSSAAMVEEIVNKIVAYEGFSGYNPRKCLFAADDEEEFEDLNDTLIGYLSADFSANKAYLRSYAHVDDATNDIIDGVDEGMLITNYVGHGSLTNWAGEYMFQSSDVALLNNETRLSFVIALDCLNGYFAQSMPGGSQYSIGQEFVLAGNKGAIAHFGPSGLGYTWEQEILGKEIFETIFDQGKNIIGYITTQSKIDAYAGGVSDDCVKMFTLFGDPASVLKYGDAETLPPASGGGGGGCFIATVN
ncbi:MAG: C25 family cysteine peptidase, partial [Thermodesulfobacteriota bacterium]|nr:C25 family cysteine peptidase [Thermodesulfobacteriota bacterium]